MEKLILGIDEAGRGPVIGPLVVAGCLVTGEVEKQLKKIGVKDSKDLTQKRREFLAEKIKELAETFEIEIALPNEIDDKVGSGNLNELEAKKIASIINKINKGFRKIFPKTRTCRHIQKNLANLERTMQQKRTEEVGDLKYKFF